MFLSTLLFSKLVLFSHYPMLNIPIKFALLYVYSATLDPLMAYSGYTLTKLYQENEVIQSDTI